MQNLRLDRRLIERQGWISPPELEGELDSLPDAAHKATTLGAAEDDGKPSDPAPAVDSPFPSA